MRSKAWMVVVLAAILVNLVAACGPDQNTPKPGGGGGNVNSAPAKNDVPVEPDYIVTITAEDAHNPKLERVSRMLTCSIVGTDAGNDIVTVTDPLTGRSAPYSLSVARNTPTRLLLYGARGLTFLAVVCVMRGRPGDAVVCRFTLGDGRRPAPLVLDRPVGVVPRGVATAFCQGTINTLA